MTVPNDQKGKREFAKVHWVPIYDMEMVDTEWILRSDVTLSTYGSPRPSRQVSGAAKLWDTLLTTYDPLWPCILVRHLMSQSYPIKTSRKPP